MYMYIIILVVLTQYRFENLIAFTRKKDDFITYSTTLNLPILGVCVPLLANVIIATSNTYIL